MVFYDYITRMFATRIHNQTNFLVNQKVIVVVAKIASLSTTPVLALTPLGISIDKTGLFEVFTIWIHFFNVFS